jgi:phage protein D
MSTDVLQIYQGQDFYVPYFEVKVGDRPLEREAIHDITQVSYRDSLTEIDSFEITINNWDAEARTFKYSDRDLFDPGARVELYMGYMGRDRTRLMCTGEITSLRPAFPAAGQPTLVVSGLNLLHTLRGQQRSVPYVKMTDSKIARQVAKRLPADIDTNAEAARNEEEHDYILQDNQYDLLFLLERARRNGYDLFVVEGKERTVGGKTRPRIYFGPSQDVRRVSYELTYGKSLIEFQPDLSTAQQVGKVTVHGWDAVKKKAINITVNIGQLDIAGVGAKGGQARINKSFQDREEVISNIPVATEREGRTLAKETLSRILKNMLKGSGSVVGLPDLRAGSVIFIRGVGERFSGRYFVTATTHTIGDGGYTTQFQCRREELKGSQQ